MAFTLPKFSLDLAFWKVGTTPLFDPPSGPYKAQIYEPSRQMFVERNELSDQDLVYQQIRLDLAFFNGEAPPFKGAIFGYTDPAATVWYYNVRWWDRQHHDFGNEYVLVYALQCQADGSWPDSGR